MSPYQYLASIPETQRSIDDYRRAAKMPGGAWAPEAYGMPSKHSWVLFLSDGQFEQWCSSNLDNKLVKLRTKE